MDLSHLVEITYKRAKNACISIVKMVIIVDYFSSNQLNTITVQWFDLHTTLYLQVSLKCPDGICSYALYKAFVFITVPICGYEYRWISMFWILSSFLTVSQLIFCFLSRQKAMVFFKVSFW